MEGERDARRRRARPRPFSPPRTTPVLPASPLASLRSRRLRPSLARRSEHDQVERNGKNALCTHSAPPHPTRFAPLHGVPDRPPDAASLCVAVLRRTGLCSSRSGRHSRPARRSTRPTCTSSSTASARGPSGRFSRGTLTCCDGELEPGAGTTWLTGFAQTHASPLTLPCTLPVVRVLSLPFQT